MDEVLFLLQNPMCAIFFGFLTCAFVDCVFAVSTLYIERALLARDFRHGRLSPFQGLDNPEISYYIIRQIKEKYPDIFENAK